MSEHFSPQKTNGSITPETARRVAEAARENKWEKPVFLRDLFLGKFRLDLLADLISFNQALTRPEFLTFYEEMLLFLDNFDSEAADRNRRIPKRALKSLADMGAFGMKIDQKYGGLGFSLSEYCQIMKLIGSRDGNIASLLSAHQSIGVPEPLKLFGTDAQKEKYFPKLAKGAVSAFALTESDVGSDPVRLATTVKESSDGKAYMLNGEKLWCTNGTIAKLLVVMARHESDNAISAFIVETGWEGVQITQRCEFMGLKALENGQLNFHNVRIPKENLLWKRGKGLKLALMTLNTGRLTIPALTTGNSKACLEISRKWGKERIQWGKPIGQHEAITQKIADMAADTFSQEAVADLSTQMAEKGFDVRLEAAIAKLYNTEKHWKIVDDAMQIRGGRGYETERSLKARGERGIPIERFMRDSRINRIFEGSSEIMRLFIAREAVDKHLQIAGVLLENDKPFSEKAKALPKIAFFYARWYLSLLLGWGRWPRYKKYGKLAKHLRFVERRSRKLARQVFRGMIRYRATMERRQAFLGRIVDIGAELFAMTATILKAHQAFQEGNRNAVNLANLACKEARINADRLFEALWKHSDRAKYKIGHQVLDKQFTWLEDGAAGIAEDQRKTIEEWFEESIFLEEGYFESSVASVYSN